MPFDMSRNNDNPEDIIKGYKNGFLKYKTSFLKYKNGFVNFFDYSSWGRKVKGYATEIGCCAASVSGGASMFGISFISVYALHFLITRRFFRKFGNMVPTKLSPVAKRIRNDYLLVTSTMIGTCIAYSHVRKECQECALSGNGS